MKAKLFTKILVLFLLFFVSSSDASYFAAQPTYNFPWLQQGTYAIYSFKIYNYTLHPPQIQRVYFGWTVLNRNSSFVLLSLTFNDSSGHILREAKAFVNIYSRQTYYFNGTYAGYSALWIPPNTNGTVAMGGKEPDVIYGSVIPKFSILGLSNSVSDAEGWPRYVVLIGNMTIISVFAGFDMLSGIAIQNNFEGDATISILNIGSLDLNTTPALLSTNAPTGPRQYWIVFVLDDFIYWGPALILLIAIFLVLRRKRRKVENN